MTPLAGLPPDATTRIAKTHVQKTIAMSEKSAVVMVNLFAAKYNDNNSNKNAAIDNHYNKNSKTIFCYDGSHPNPFSADYRQIPPAELSSSNDDDNHNNNDNEINNDVANGTDSDKESVPHLVASRAKASRHDSTPLLRLRSKQQATHLSHSSVGQSGGGGSNFYFSKSTGGVSGGGGGSNTNNNDLFGGIMGNGGGGNDDDDEEEEEEDFVEAVIPILHPALAAQKNLRRYLGFIGHEFFIEVSEEFIKDDFNLTGLNTLVLLYNEALDMILDLELDPQPTPAQLSLIESSAEMLYGLIHQRFLLTKGGLGVMSDRLAEADFGACPREGCGGASVLPCGRSDQPSVDTVKMFCVRCCDLYHPREAKFQNIDGAFFGTTFPHLLYNTYPQLIPPVITPAKSASEAVSQEATAATTRAEDGGDDDPQPIALAKLPNYRVYVPRLFGFRLSERSQTGPRMGWLRWKDGVDLGAGDGIVARSMEVGMYRHKLVNLELSVAQLQLPVKAKDMGFSVAKFPAIFGYDIGGIISKTRTEVDNLPIGTHYGGFQEFVLVPEELVSPIPDELSFIEAALPPMAVHTSQLGITQANFETFANFKTPILM
ncbi:casein kinase 2 regulatory subunit [Physocladia obscura]|uniref:Casein kinase II subunit beta n=1 Tax=Physocladia obscura TaxID=109957 RepID=A0AAD5T5V2_9FUNG|nr:casein kinase 2 regulatory subunit [Physocladia obscura]